MFLVIVEYETRAGYPTTSTVEAWEKRSKALKRAAYWSRLGGIISARVHEVDAIESEPGE